MAHILFKNGEAVYITTESPFTGTPALAVLKDEAGNVIDYDSAENSFRLDSFEQAEVVAAQLTAKFGKIFLACDNGEHTSHQFGVMEAPKVGDPVSFGFNGDYYPCGVITRITPGWRIYAEDASKPEGARRQKTTFNRKKKSSCWKMVGGTWSLVFGHVDERNPHF